MIKKILISSLISFSAFCECPKLCPIWIKVYKENYNEAFFDVEKELSRIPKDAAIEWLKKYKPDAPIPALNFTPDEKAYLYLSKFYIASLRQDTKSMYEAHYQMKNHIEKTIITENDLD